jgi:hypothetical protein
MSVREQRLATRRPVGYPTDAGAGAGDERDHDRELEIMGALHPFGE